MFNKIIFGKRKTPPQAQAAASPPPATPTPPTPSPRAQPEQDLYPYQSPSRTWREQWQMIVEAKRDAVLMLPVVPASKVTDPISFVGGLPVVSNKFVWPRGITYDKRHPRIRHAWEPPKEPEPTPQPQSRSFVGQVDCASLPAFGQRNLLPERGRLCFFIDWTVFESGAPYTYAHADAVVWDDGDGPLQEAAAPPDLPPCHDVSASYYYRWVNWNEPERYPRTFEKWPLELHTINTYPDATYLDPSGASQPTWQAIVHRLMREQYRSIVLDPPREAPFRHEPGPLRPSPSFPECWLHVQMTAELIAAELRSQLRINDPPSPKKSPPQPLPPALEAGTRATLEDVNRVVADTKKRSPFGMLTPSERENFYRWIETLVVPKQDRGGHYDRRNLTHYNGCINTAHARVGEIMASRGADTEALLDASTINDVRLCRSPYIITRQGQSGLGTCHQMLGHGGNVQSAAQQFRSHVLLAQFASDSHGPFMWGDLGLLQYWIDPADLEARDFSRVFVTQEST